MTGRNARPSTAPAKEQDDDGELKSNWSNFIQAYANGLWDPHREPTSPDRNQISVPLHRVRASFSNHTHVEQQKLQHHPIHHFGATHLHEAQTTAAALRWAGSLVDISPLALPSPEHELTDPMRNAMAVIPGSHPVDPDQMHPLTPHIGSPTPHHSFSPPMPSKSPMKLTLNRRRSDNAWTKNHDDHVLTPGGGRSRLASFWEGTQDVDEAAATSTVDIREKKRAHVLGILQEIPIIEAKPPTPDPEGTPDELVALPLATDYFALAHSPSSPSHARTRDSNSDSEIQIDSQSHPESHPPRPAPAPLQVSSLPSLPFQSVHSAPAVPRRMTLTRQTSSPLPSAASNPYPSGSSPANLFQYPYSDSQFPTLISEHQKSPSSSSSSYGSGSGTPPGPTTASNLALDLASASTSGVTPIMPASSAPGGSSSSTNVLNVSSPPSAGSSSSTAKVTREEQLYRELGYLVPPNPPDELERRRALYKFNIWNTGPDLNFDRIAHLAKLVFNTKGVVISLIDGQDQWFKSEWGVKTPSCARGHSFCAHAILQRGDEPMIVLDAHLDWRFAHNPLVTGPPYIRFYAGAPLRTQEGYNIGTLMVVDESPRDDFTPRQRHTLKEFAAIAMREMELWRDKIQLRIRDRIQTSMEQFSRECLEIDSEAQAQGKVDRPDLIVGASMDKVYSRAAKLVKRTLDVEGVIVMDVSHCEVLETMNSEGSVTIVMHHGEPVVSQPDGLEGGDSTDAVIAEVTTRQLTAEEYSRLNAFFVKHPDGKISETIVPFAFRPFLPTRIQYALTVPIFNIDKRPFALLCAYNASEHTKRFLEGHELSYMRAIGVIILSAVLKRRMILADKAKSLFISNISHELRTPLHGILAAAELLSETPLSHSQESFLQTVQACGTSLVETVNHVLDFTKLSGNTKAGGVEKVILPSKVDLMQLVEEAVDGCWIGHRARMQIMRDSEIGSVYSPPEKDVGHVAPVQRQHVETVVDVGYREAGWLVKCEKGGIRRVLMNLFGNSLKFTADGFVHVVLRQLPSNEDEPPNKIKVELGVFDTGKGISQNFLKNQLFHPFSQENPLQTGTGLGLAIVHSIVHSESVGGKVDVWSEEGTGTEIRVTFTAEVPEDAEATSDSDVLRPDNLGHSHTISLIGFDEAHDGVKLLRRVLEEYLVRWWGFVIQPEALGFGDIVILNNDPSPVVKATELRDTARPFVILSASRGNPAVMAIASEYERIGGFCRIIYKPGGPTRLRAVMKLCLHAIHIVGKSDGPSPSGVVLDDTSHPSPEPSPVFGAVIPRRNSEDSHKMFSVSSARPALPRSSTAHPGVTSWTSLASTIETSDNDDQPDHEAAVPTISVGAGGTLLKSSIGTIDSANRRFRVLVVEDNSILRSLLVKWLKTKGYDFRDAVDGQDGVQVYERDGPFDVVLLDLSMPVLDGIGATTQIRRIESTQSPKTTGKGVHPTRILALTGMSSLEDKRKAFEAGVDGYLVKPVAFKTLDEMFHRLGVS